MKNAWGAVQGILGLVIVAALIIVLVVVFRSLSGGTAAAPGATAGPVTGYPALAPTWSPAQLQTAYPGFGATQAGSPSPTSILDTIGFTPTPALPPLNDSPDQFDPKTYGLPDTIAGYTVLGVKTPKNTACVFSGRNTLVLQSTEPTVQDALKNDRTADVMKAMGQLGLNTTEWDISVGGPKSTRAQVIADIQQWNKDSQKYGCVTTGGPALTAVPTPTQ